jgi:transposase
LYSRLAARRGTKQALVAVGHTILVIASHVLAREESSREGGANDVDPQDRQAV